MANLDRTFLIRLDNAMHAHLKKLATIRRTSIGSLVREAVVEHFRLAEPGRKRRPPR